MKLDVYTKTLTALKDTLIIAVIAILGWRYFPLLIDPAQTSNFEIAEINLLVVKLKPEASERAVPAGVPAAEESVGNESGDQSGTDPSDSGNTSNSATNPQPSSNVAYYAEQRGGELSSTQVAIPTRNIVSKEDNETQRRVMGWSYLGTYRGDKYLDLIFDVDNSQKPEALVGKRVKANTDVFIRDDYPKFVIGWTKGDRMGVISKGSEIEIKDVKLIPAKGGGSRVWVKS